MKKIFILFFIFYFLSSCSLFNKDNELLKNELNQNDISE
jgi:hypothetical protein